MVRLPAAVASWSEANKDDSVVEARVSNARVNKPHEVYS